MAQKVWIFSKDKWWLIAVGLAIGLGIAFPWLGGGRLLLLDWPVGPNQPAITPQAYGLQGGLITGLLVQIILYPVFHLLSDYATTLIIVAIFPVAAVAIGSLVGGNPWTKISAAVFYCVNPFVYDRIYAGQLSIIFGYAILPFAVKSLLAQGEPSRTRWVKTGLWWIALITCAPHFVWIFGVIFGVFTLLSICSRTVLMKLLFSAIFTGLSIIYELISGLSGGIGIHVGNKALLAYQTRGGPGIGLFENVLGLYGFWRKGPVLAKQLITAWPILLVGIILVATFGMIIHYKDNSYKSDKKKVILLAVAGAIGLFLAMGAQGPTGVIFRFVYHYVPFFKIMREPQKFLALWALVLAVGFGWGIGHLYNKAIGSASKVFTILVALGLCVAYEPLMFNGLGGQVETTKFPHSWFVANHITGKGQGSILALPWHLYLAYPFSAKRVIANPSPGFFNRSVISGDNEQLPGLQSSSTLQRSAFLQYVYNHGADISNFGSIAAPLGIKYVILEKTADWRNYFWLNNQTDLKKIYDTKSIEVFKNQSYEGLGDTSSRLITVPNWGSILSIAQLGQLKGQIIRAQHPSPGPIVPPQPVSASSSPLRIKQSLPVEYRIASKTKRWVQLFMPYETGWFYQRRPGLQLAEGNIGWTSNSWSSNKRTSKVFFAPVETVLVGYVISISTLSFGTFFLLFDGYLLKKKAIKAE